MTDIQIQEIAQATPLSFADVKHIYESIPEGEYKNIEGLEKLTSVVTRAGWGAFYAIVSLITPEPPKLDPIDLEILKSMPMPIKTKTMLQRFIYGFLWAIFWGIVALIAFVLIF